MAGRSSTERAAAAGTSQSSVPRTAGFGRVVNRACPEAGLPLVRPPNSRHPLPPSHHWQCNSLLPLPLYFLQARLLDHLPTHLLCVQRLRGQPREQQRVVGVRLSCLGVVSRVRTRQAVSPLVATASRQSHVCGLLPYHPRLYTELSSSVHQQPWAPGGNRATSGGPCGFAWSWF